MIDNILTKMVFYCIRLVAIDTKMLGGVVVERCKRLHWLAIFSILLVLNSTHPRMVSVDIALPARDGSSRQYFFQ